MKVIIKETEVDITEDEALYIINDIRNAFGWTGTEFTRHDVESTLERKITDEEWDKVQDTHFWSRGMRDAMTETGWDYVEFATEEAGL